MKIRLSENEMSIIQIALNAQSCHKCDKIIVATNNLYECSKKDIWYLIDCLTNLIGYDPIKDDIDSLGKEADDIITKLLQVLTERGEI